MMKGLKIFQNEIFYLSAITLFFICLFSYYSFVSHGCEGGMDSYNHYLIARYSWKYPYLFLDQWGKPLYTILASPFANMGFSGVKLFNIFLWLGSAWLTWATVKKLGMNYAWLGFLLVLLPQVSIENSISGLTEYLNEFLLILFLYLIATKRFNLAALVCGLLPFARSEGFVIMAAAGFYLVFIEKKYKSLLWFVAGPVIFNILGWIVEGDPLWIITHNPYLKAQDLNLNFCGTGSLWHYVKQARFIFSLAGALLVIPGILLSGHFSFKKENNTTFLNKYMFWLAGGIFSLYFGVHSYIWWKGMMGSCGYTRVMIVITPLMALLSAYAIHSLSQNFIRYKHYLQGIAIVLVLVSISQSYKFIKYKFPMEISDEQKEFVKVAMWLKTYDYHDNMIYFLYPYLNILANIDPYDKKHFEFLWSFDFDYSPVGSVLIWDGHFGPNECRIPLEKLKNDTDFILIKSFIPEKPFTTLNNYPFEIHVFKRVKNSHKAL